MSGATKALTDFVEAQSVPVAHTMTGKGAIACTHPLSAGLFGRYDRIANALIERSDCLLVVGCKLGEIATRRFTLIPDGVPLIHLDIVAEELGRTARPNVALWGDCREGLRDLADALDADDRERLRAERADYAAEVKARMTKWRAEVDHRLTSDESPINMARMIHELNGILDREAVLVADGGFAAHWCGLLYDTKTSRGAASCRTAASPPSATACPAPWAHGSPHPAARSSASPATAASTW